MIQGYAIEDGRLRPVPDPLVHPETVVWLDLLSPSPEEEAAVEKLVGIDVPTLDEMVEIEDSSRLYVDAGAVFLTAILATHADTGHPVAAPVTFILTGHRLVTVRYDTPRAFETFPQRAERVDLGCSDGKGQQDFRGVLQGVGAQADVISHVLSSLVTIERLVAFLSAARGSIAADKEARTRLKSLARDTRFLADHANFLSQKITFLLDATLGMISIQQNAIIKIFSVAAVIFLPPTLVASIYGMNFTVMPELQWAFGYPMAIVLMVASAVGSYWVFKTRGWL